MRGFIVVPYVLWLLGDVILTTLAVASRKLQRVPIRTIHLGRVFATLLVYGAITKASGCLLSVLDPSLERGRVAGMLTLSKAVALDGWSLDDPGQPKEARVRLRCMKDGSVIVGLAGRSTQGDMVQVGSTANEEVRAASTFDFLCGRRIRRPASRASP